MIRRIGLSLFGALLLAGCSSAPPPAASAAIAPSPPAPVYDVIIRNGTIYDGSGGAPYVGDVLVNGDRIVSVGGPAAKGSGTHRNRRDRARGLPRLHQHAELGTGDPDRRRSRA